MRSMALLVMFLVPCICAAQTSERRQPVIDVHMHAYPASFAGSVERWVETNRELFRLPVFDTVHAAKTDAAVLEGTLAAMKRYNVVRAVVSGPLLQSYMEAAPNRIIRSLDLIEPKLGLESLKEHFTSGRYQVLGEMATQYAGVSPDDARLEPYFAQAEQLGVPVGIHMGMGGPGFATYRARLGNPLLLEEVLVRHPGLRVYVMHAGYPMLEEMVALMQTYPQVYVDVAEINWVRPRASFHAHLRGLVDAGFEKRILFGSDQMAWPDAIGVAIQTIETAQYLTQQQKRDILCNNAARFLKLPEEICRE